MRLALILVVLFSTCTSPALAQLPLFEGFESFPLGTFDTAGVNGWSGTHQTFSIANSNPSAGSQHLRLTKVPFAGGPGAVSPTYSVLADQPHSVSVDIYISSLGAQSARVFSDGSPGEEAAAWDVLFGANGHILVRDDEDGLPGGFDAYIDTGATWSPAAYFTLRVDRDPIANALKVFTDDTLIYTASSVYDWGGYTAERVILWGDNSFGPGDFTDYDNFAVVPAPGALVLCGLAGLGLTRRRR